MAKFKSRYSELAFYVGDERKQFVAGVFKTEDARTIKALDSLSDATRVDEPKPEPAKPAEEPKETPKPAPRKKAPAKRKASSAK
ncbi:hypothetical protein [Alteribacter populi]|uniref:hypothetical protein n=1 Tax=Alteribacter populi TaxID=2011011 RepID=UPI000BBB47B6|nr:hypothetical protein [Alteribacter populi]